MNKNKIIILFFLVGIIAFATQFQVTAQAASYDYIKISVDSTTHNDYGLAYPITYTLSIPSGSSGLKVYRRYTIAQAWTQITEYTSDDFFNGIEAVRFDYPNDMAFVSVAFSDISDEIHLKVTNVSGEIVDILDWGIPDYYDNRDAVVTITGDDWDGFTENNTAFKAASAACASRQIWFTAGITTQGQADVEPVPDTSWDPVDYDEVRPSVDAGYIEIASHSRTHPGECTFHPYEYTGSHTGADDSFILTDSNANYFFDASYGFPTDVRAYLVEATIINGTDGSSCVITDNTINTITCDLGLSGGIDNQWDIGDTYIIDNYDREIGTSKDEIIAGLVLPYNKGIQEYVYAWLDPCGTSDTPIQQTIGEYKYIVDRTTIEGENSFTDTPLANGHYTIGGSLWLEESDLATANSLFDTVVTDSGIYHIMIHPQRFQVWNAGGDVAWNVEDHLDYIAGDTTIWYVGFGHLYLYHYISDQEKVNLELIVGETDGDGDGGGGGGGGHCFIATAAYGTPMAGEVNILSKFRDEYLIANPIGKSFVAAYYKVSPRIADFIREHPVLKKIVRITLNPLIWMSEKSIEE